MTETKEYKSLFVPQLKVGISSHITELIINNKIEWHIKKSGSSKPKCAFWKKDVANEHPEFKQLQKDYTVEISYVKNLLKCFAAKTVISYIKDRGIITLRYLPLDKQKTVIYNLFNLELKHQKEEASMRKKSNDRKLVTKKQERPSQQSNLSGLL
tara:strand:- start:372 stop:836 length:465 start_codon:yes stop_codon:yes gene_type:complete